MTTDKSTSYMTACMIGQSVYSAQSPEVKKVLEPIGVETERVSGQIGLHCSSGESSW